MPIDAYKSLEELLKNYKPQKYGSNASAGLYDNRGFDYSEPKFYDGEPSLREYPIKPVKDMYPEYCETDLNVPHPDEAGLYQSQVEDVKAFFEEYNRKFEKARKICSMFGIGLPIQLDAGIVNRIVDQYGHLIDE